MAAIRRATAKWTGDLASGAGEVSAGTSGAFSELPVTWASRTEAADGLGRILSAHGRRLAAAGRRGEARVAARRTRATDPATPQG